jgi:tRNA (guanosine-2'-O-)-methyltransferase
MHDAISARPFSNRLLSPIPEHPAEHLLTEKRRERFRQVLARRTGRLSVVIEECYDPQNATAIVRTCDCLGIHRMHVVTNRNAFQVNRRVSQGAHLNLDLRLHGHIDDAYAELRADGFHILASNLHADAAIGPGSLEQQLESQPLALVFGNEGHGLSEEACQGADGFFVIPMVGFPQSLNLSVSVAMCAYALRQRNLEQDLAGDLSREEQCRWFEQWIRRSAQVDRYCTENDLPPIHEMGQAAEDRQGNAIDRMHAHDGQGKKND